MSNMLKGLALGMGLCGLTVTAYAWEPPAEDCVKTRMCEHETLVMVQDCKADPDCTKDILVALRALKNACKSVMVDVCRPEPSKGTLEDADPDDLEACMDGCSYLP